MNLWSLLVQWIGSFIFPFVLEFFSRTFKFLKIISSALTSLQNFVQYGEMESFFHHKYIHMAKTDSLNGGSSPLKTLLITYLSDPLSAP